MVSQTKSSTFLLYLILIYDKQPTFPQKHGRCFLSALFSICSFETTSHVSGSAGCTLGYCGGWGEGAAPGADIQWLDLREESTGSPLYYQPNPWRKFCQNSQATNSGTVFLASCEFSAVLAKHAKQICVSHGFKGSSRFCWVRTEISMPNKLVKSSWALFWGLGLVNLGLTLVVDSLEEHVCCDVAVSLRLLMVFRLDLPIFDTWTNWETASIAEWLFWRPEIRGDDLMGRASRVSSATAGSSLSNVSDF